jgi:hypothetical protein
MQSKNSYSEAQCGTCCPECIVTRPHHCTHCPEYGRATVNVEDAHDYSHLIGNPVRPREEEFDAAQFDGLLTDDDRILLGFGMHILW